MGSARKSETGQSNGTAKQLAKSLRASLLPGEKALDARRLKPIAAFMAEAAQHRPPGKANIAIDTSGDDGRVMRIAIVNDDMPFLVDSVAAALAEQKLVIDCLLHPVTGVVRSEKGDLVEISQGKRKKEGGFESLIYIETARVDARARRMLRDALRSTLADVRAAVSDWPALRQAMLADAQLMADTEGGALLRWLESGMLTMLGHVRRKRDGSESERLGICRKSASQLLAEESYARAFAHFDALGDRALDEGPLVIKANRVSQVHRRVPLDLFIIPVVEGEAIVALDVNAGVWTSAALNMPPADVPLLRQHLIAMADKLDFDPTGHAGKALVHAFAALPHDLLIGFSAADIERVTTTMMSLVDSPRPRLAMAEGALSRHLFAFVWLPRDMVSTQARERISTLLRAETGGDLLDWSLHVEGGSLATLRFVLDIRQGGAMPDAADVEAKLETMLRGWAEAVETELAQTEDAGRAAAIARRYAAMFPDLYRSEYGAAEAAIDIRRLRKLAIATREGAAAVQRDARLYRKDGDPDGQLRLKVYQLGGALLLSDAVPALENFGFRVLAEMPIELEGDSAGSIHDFLLEPNGGADVEEMVRRASIIEAAIGSILRGEAEDDPFNRLVTSAGLGAQEANWLRAFYRYLRQGGMGFTIYTVVDALQQARDVTSGLIALLTTRHDPDFEGDRAKAADKARRMIRDGLSRVKAINDDRLLRLYQGAIEAILRTNAFAPAGQEALAFKFDSACVPGLPKPLPWREIFVYSRRVEGIHLRAGPVARGGLRWSDRRDDFRIEILGLMKAQRVKNAVIVPTGAKGGFYPKQLPDPSRDREGWAAEGQASYEVFIRALLSITDNIADGAVVHPDAVTVTDGEDPYFVVAADKGTARFSDVANAIAEDRGFWLGDAFASGGSNGYDHKAMGITARGAWVSVQRHFLEMGIDVQKDPVTVAGCGDMSGDVFGNGMLLSKAIKLVAAFDHRHIFIDPDPDPAKSWKERKRLFDLPRSSWADYSEKLISKGGGVFARDMKRISLSPEIRKLLDIDAKEIEPETLIAAIMASPVELIWFGGIGTYIKAESENNVDVGDPANDAVRINAAQVRAKVIGEGANLGCTQAGRIAFALGGGRINTDFIDNSAGVDCSDNEVNIKIALAAARQAGRLSEDRRNTLLEEMTDEVADIVLEDNRLQALALSIAEIGDEKVAASHVRVLETLEEGGNLDAKTEGLAASEAYMRRAADGQGMTRPELAVLLSSVKLVLQAAIEASDLPDDPEMTDLLVGAFPQPMQGAFNKPILEHRLRRELIATKLANRIVNRIGIIHPFELVEEEGAELAQVAAAFTVVERLFGVSELWADIERAAMPEIARLTLFDRLGAAFGNLMSDVLRTYAGAVNVSAITHDLAATIATLSRATDDLVSSETRQQSRALQDDLVNLGAPEKLAARVRHLFEMDGSVGLARLARGAECDVVHLTRAFIDIGSRIGLDWAQSTAALMSPSDIWERLLVDGLARDYQQIRLDFLRRVMRRKGGKEDPVAAVASWAEANASGIRQFRTIIARAQTSTPVAPAVLAQIASQARNLLGR